MSIYKSFCSWPGGLLNSHYMRSNFTTTWNSLVSSQSNPLMESFNSFLLTNDLLCWAIFCILSYRSSSVSILWSSLHGLKARANRSLRAGLLLTKSWLKSPSTLTKLVMSVSEQRRESWIKVSRILLSPKCTLFTVIGKKPLHLQVWSLYRLHFLYQTDRFFSFDFAQMWQL